ncbi:MAG: hypothetical protein AB7P49_13155, partial [Bdellovibrionales bacterium]
MMVYRTTILSLVLLLAPITFAVKMDETTHDMVIRRLEMGIDTMDKDAPERTGVLLRLGDLYADRARLKAINEMESGCTNAKCAGSRDDRRRAIALYNEALPRAPKEKQGNVVLHIAHLHNLNDESRKSLELYRKILSAPKSTYSSEVKAIANS